MRLWMAVLLFASTASAQWTQVDEAGNPFPSLPGQWQVTQLTTPFGSFNGWRTQTSTKKPCYLVHFFEPTRQVVEVRFLVKTPPANRRGLTFGLSYGTPTHWAQEAVRLALGGNGFVLKRDIGDWFTWRSRFSWLPTLNFSYNSWLQVRLVADPTISAFRLWLKDGTRDEGQGTENLPFLSPTPQLSCVFLFNGEGDGTTIEVSEPEVRIGTLPNAPKSLRVTPIASDRLRLTWQPLETPNIRSYRLYRRGQFVTEVPVDKTEWVDTRVQSGEAYGYFVTAIAAISEGAAPAAPHLSAVQESRLPTCRAESLPSWIDAAMPLPKQLPSLLQRSPPNLWALYDVVVIGATPAGIAAAITAARFGHSVALVERTIHIGGMMTGGLSATDRRYRKASGGLFAEFLKRTERFYAQAYGANSSQHRACRDGYLFEPKVASQTFWHMLAETPNLHLYLRHELGGALKDGNRVVAALLNDRMRAIRWRVDGKVFIDATYEGDLAALAGAVYRVGREGRNEFGEEYAGEVFWDSRNREITFGKPDGDKKVQAYNYRLTLTKRADNRRSIAAPPDYDPDRYAEIAQRVSEGVLWHPMEVVSLVKLPQQKFDANNTPGPFPSTDFIGANYDYPEAQWWQREQIARAHQNHIVGLLYFLQADERLPDWFRAAAQHWGFASDEFPQNENFPPQLYVREARRIVGDFIFTENDAKAMMSGRRAPLHEDSIAVAEYPIDSHACTPLDPKQPYLHEGFFYLPQITVPSHIPYRVMLPKSQEIQNAKPKPIEGLLVCGAVSATHIGFGTLRLEPVWMALGQAAGTAAHLALKHKVSLRQVPVDELQRLLLEQKQVIAFFTDLPSPDTPEFAAVQFFAVRGFFDTYELRANEVLDEGAARKVLHRFAEILRCPIPFSFGTAREQPTQGEIVHWLAALLNCTPDEVLHRCGANDYRPDEPLLRGKLFVWLYRLWWTGKEQTWVRQEMHPPNR